MASFGSLRQSSRNFASVCEIRNIFCTSRLISSSVKISWSIPELSIAKLPGSSSHGPAQIVPQSIQQQHRRNSCRVREAQQLIADASGALKQARVEEAIL